MADSIIGSSQAVLMQQTVILPVFERVFAIRPGNGEEDCFEKEICRLRDELFKGELVMRYEDEVLEPTGVEYVPAKIIVKYPLPKNLL